MSEYLQKNIDEKELIYVEVLNYLTVDNSEESG